MTQRGREKEQNNILSLSLVCALASSAFMGFGFRSSWVGFGTFLMYLAVTFYVAVLRDQIVSKINK